MSKISEIFEMNDIELSQEISENSSALGTAKKKLAKYLVSNKAKFTLTNKEMDILFLGGPPSLYNDLHTKVKDEGIDIESEDDLKKLGLSDDEIEELVE